MYANSHSSIMGKSPKVETTRMAINREGINKMSPIRTMECYSDIKWNEVLIYTIHGWTLKTLCCPGQVAQLVGASSHIPKGCGFDS